MRQILFLWLVWLTRIIDDVTNAMDLLMKVGDCELAKTNGLMPVA